MPPIPVDDLFASQARIPGFTFYNRFMHRQQALPVNDRFNLAWKRFPLLEPASATGCKAPVPGISRGKTLLLPTKSPPEADVKPCRRRPGRVENVSPALIPLMRGAFDPDVNDIEIGTRDREADDLGTARGMMAAVGLAIPLWCVLAGGVYFILW